MRAERRAVYTAASLPADLLLFQVRSPSRPPCVHPRRRPLPKGLEQTVQSWVAECLEHAAAIHVGEWVSTHSHAPPHVIGIVVRGPREYRVVLVERASDQISFGDVRAAFSVHDSSGSPRES